MAKAGSQKTSIRAVAIGLNNLDGCRGFFRVYTHCVKIC